MESYDRVENFIRIVENELKERNMSVGDLAKLLGLSRVSVYRWLKREGVMNLEKYYRILRVLDMDDKAI